MKIVGFNNEIDGILNEGGGVSNEGLKFVSKKTRQGMIGGAYSIDYRSEGDVFFTNFRLSIDLRILWVVRNRAFLNGGVERGGLYGFSNKGGYVINWVLGQNFIGGRRKKFINFRFIVRGVHYN
jgi:hypothetical protein